MCTSDDFWVSRIYRGAMGDSFYPIFLYWCPLSYYRQPLVFQNRSVWMLPSERHPLYWGSLHPLHALPPTWSDLLETSTWTWTEAPGDENLASQAHSVSTGLQQYLSMKRCSISTTEWKNEWDIRVALQDTLPYILLLGKKKEHFFCPIWVSSIESHCLWWER